MVIHRLRGDDFEFKRHNPEDTRGNHNVNKAQDPGNKQLQGTRPHVFRVRDSTAVHATLIVPSLIAVLHIEGPSPILRHPNCKREERTRIQQQEHNKRQRETTRSRCLHQVTRSTHVSRLSTSPV